MALAYLLILYSKIMRQPLHIRCCPRLQLVRSIEAEDEMAGNFRIFGNSLDVPCGACYNGGSVGMLRLFERNLR
jgi:hypothetical protein